MQGNSRKKAIKVLVILVFICSNLILKFVAPTPTFAAGVSPTASTVYGQGGSFTTATVNKGGISANSLNGTQGIVPDSSGNLYIVDTLNNRMLFYLAGSTTATRVYGQGGNFTTSNTNNPNNASAGSLSRPQGVALDSSGNVYIADTGNNRVLFYPAGSTTATRVYGQGGSFTSGQGNNGGISASSLNLPQAVVLDSSGNLYISDSGNNRVLFYPAGSTTATRVYGQGGNFTAANPNGGGVSAGSLKGPGGVALDSSGNLYIADTGNSRVLFYSAGSTTATRVYGQGGSFTAANPNGGGISASGLNGPGGVALDSSGNLYVADTGNSRVLFYPAGSTTATRVYGQGGSFTTGQANNGSGSISAASLNIPSALALASNGNLYIADTSNNRVLQFQTSLRITIQPAASIVAGSLFTIAASLVDVGSNSVFTDFRGTVSVVIKPGSGTPGASLSGITSVAAVNGVATFSNLSIGQIATGYILTVSSPGVGSANTNSFAITGGLFFIPLTTPSFSFTLNGMIGTATSQHIFRVGDTTQSGVGWHVMITSTQLTAAGGKTLPPSSISITQVSAACTTGQTCTLPTNIVSSYPITVPAAATAPPAITYFRAAGGTGTGDVTLNVTFSLRVLPGTAAGIYTSTFTETLVKGQ